MSEWIWNPMRPQTPPPASGGEPGNPIESPIPVHPLLWHPVRTRIDKDRAPSGRLVGVEYTYDYQPSETEFQDALGTNDVVWVPLFDGTIANPAQDSSRKLNEYERNVRAISEIAPRIHAILVGNANAEILFKGRPKEECHRLAITFIQTHAAFMAFHGRPAFAPVFDLLVYDCYQGGGELRDLINSTKALLISFTGATWLFDPVDTHPLIPEERPYPRLTQYLASMECWSGVGTLRGLEKGSGAVLKSSGYLTGFAGWY